MVLDAVSNFVRGSTDAEVGTEDTTVSVADASIFPDPSTDGEFNVVIWDANSFPRPDQDGDVEILRVTERDTDANELTVTREQEMTSAASHPEGSAIHLSPTAKMFSDIESTFGDFWDAGTQELTADVNNTNTTTQALEAESVSTEVAEIVEAVIEDLDVTGGGPSVFRSQTTFEEPVHKEKIASQFRNHNDTFGISDDDFTTIPLSDWDSIRNDLGQISDDEFVPDEDGYYQLIFYGHVRGEAELQINDSGEIVLESDFISTESNRLYDSLSKTRNQTGFSFTAANFREAGDGFDLAVRQRTGDGIRLRQSSTEFKIVKLG